MSFTRKISVLILLGFMFYGSTKTGTQTAGPFRSYINSVKICNKSTYPLHPSPTVTLDVNLFNASEGPALRGSFDVLNYTTNFKIKTKSLIWENGKWKTNFVLVDNGCRGSLLPFWMSFLSIAFDKKKCAFLECRVPFNIVNTNKLHHIMSPTAEYGRVLFITEMFVMGKQFKTFWCHEYETIVEPI